MESIKNKPTLAIINLNSCQGCEREILNLDELLPDLCEQVDIVYWNMISSKPLPDSIDIAVVEGAVCSNETIEFLHNLRNASKHIIALGACACGIANFEACDRKISSIESGEVASVKHCIDVDFYVRGCPINKSEFIAILHKCIFGHNAFETSAGMCGQCKGNEVGCFFGRGQCCLGLITIAGCGAICTGLGRPCMGCRGISSSANINEAKLIAEKCSLNDESQKFEDMQEACSIKRFYNKDISGLSGDLAAFVASRFNGLWSSSCVIEAIEAHEKSLCIEVSEKDQILRELLKLGELIQNHVAFIYYQELRSAYGYADIFEFGRARANVIGEVYRCRHAGTSICEVIGGRGVHPITPVVGGFTVYPDVSQIECLNSLITGEIDFAVKSVDLCNEVWEKCDVVEGSPVMCRVLATWDNLSDEARFAAAKVGLVPGLVDPRRECVAAAVDLVDAFARARQLCEEYISVVSHG